MFCKHLDTEAPVFACKAFPEEIPEEIVLGQIRHDKVLPDQVGEYVFEKIEENY